MKASEAVDVRRVGPGDAGLLRSLRLTALASDPHAFARTHEEESALAAGEWRSRAESQAEGREETTFLASIQGEVVGLVGAHRRRLGRRRHHRALGDAR